MADEAQETLLVADKVNETTSWFSEENREVVERCGWKEPNDAIKGYRGLEKDYSSKVKMPTPESSAEEIRAFYQKTGCPENPDGYEVVVPEDLKSFRDEGTENTIKQIAYEQGVSKQAFESIVKGYYEKLSADMDAGKIAGEKALREEFLGEKYDEVVAVANRFFDSCSSEFCALVKATGLANNPIFIKEFHEKGKQTMSDTLVKGQVGGEQEKGYEPQYKDSPEMYSTGEDEDSKKARAYFTARGYKYQGSPQG